METGRSGGRRRRRAGIIVDLRTLTTKKPTLAALAYLTKPQPGKLSPNGNPASIYCTKLGGTDLFGGVNASGGGWILGSSVNSVIDVLHLPGRLDHRLVRDHLPLAEHRSRRGPHEQVPLPAGLASPGLRLTNPARLDD